MSGIGESRSQRSAVDAEARALAALHGDELREALGRRFNLADLRVELAAAGGKRSFELERPSNSDDLISEQDYVLDERLPYWADLWASSRALGQVLLAERGEGRSLLELGCGLGLVSSAALAAGFCVTSSDYYEDALHVTRWNAWKNLGVEPAVRMVNWRELPRDLGSFDVVAAADVLYEEEYAGLVSACLARTLERHGTALIADPGRPMLGRFIDSLAEVELGVIDRQHIPVVDALGSHSVQVLRITRMQ